jgi:glycosyltransferase involved in cell wall biosynthesis
MGNTEGSMSGGGELKGVFVIPKNHEYVRKLKRHLEDLGTQVELLKPFHYSSLSNIGKMLWLTRKGFRIVHVHWLYVFPFPLVMKGFYYFCRMLGLKIIWEMHNIVPHNFKPKDVVAGSWFYERVDGVIYHSESDIERAEKTLKTKNKKLRLVVPHGSFDHSYENIMERAEARKRLQIPADKKVILCFGFIRKNRGYEYLIEATRDMDDTLVIIAGRLLEKDAYERLLEYQKGAPNMRIFAQWIPDDEVQIFFNACDIVVLPYTQITTSGVIPLAYSFSRPVITSAIGGIKDVVNKKTGILVPPGEPDALKKAILQLFGMDFEGMGRSAREFSDLHLAWEPIARKVERLYDEVSGGQSRRHPDQENQKAGSNQIPS